MSSKIKTMVYRSLITISFAELIIFLIWFFSLEGTRSSYYYMKELSRPIQQLTVLGCTPIFIALLVLLLNRFLPEIVKTILSGISIVLSVVVIAVFIYLPADFIQAAAELPSDTPPVLQVESSLGSNAVPNYAVVCVTAKPSCAEITWGVDGKTVTSVREEKPVRVHVFRLTDLLPGTTYRYRVNAGTYASFKTPRVLSAGADTTLLHLAVGSDPHFGYKTSNPEQTARILKTVSAANPSFDYLFTLGDTVTEGRHNSEWVEAVTAYSKYLRIPMHALIGNHCLLPIRTDHYRAYFSPEGMVSSSGSPFYGRVDVGTVHILYLKLLWDMNDFGSDQMKWLESQLQSIPKTDWVIVMTHCMFWSSGLLDNGRQWWDQPDTTKNLAPVLEKYKVDLVFSGHNHHMEYLSKDGVSYFIAGAMGGSLDKPRDHVSPYSVWYQSGTFGFIDLDIRNEKSRVMFRNADGSLIKEFVIKKNIK